jgi:hypothetical protein
VKPLMQHATKNTHRSSHLRLDAMIPRDVKARLIKMAQAEQCSLSRLCSRLLATTETTTQGNKP